MTDRRIDFAKVDIASIQPLQGRRLRDVRAKHAPGLILRVTSKQKGGAIKRTWCARYVDGNDHDRRMTLGFWPAMSYQDAVKALNEARKIRAGGKDPIEARDAAARAIAGRMTVAELVAQFEAIRAPALKSGGETVRLLRKHVEPVLGTLAVADVGEDQIHAVLTKERARLAADDAGIAKMDAARRKEAQKAGTAAPRALKRRTFTLVNRIASALGSLFTFAVDQKVIKATPMPKMTKGKGPFPSENEKGRDFTDAEVRRVWTGIDATRMDARTQNALRLILLTAMRPSEVLGLRRRDIDMSATFVDRRGGAERRRGGGLVTLKDTKNSMSRIVPLSPAACAVLADALREAGSGPDDYVFAAETAGESKPMEAQALARAMARRSDVFGDDITPHRLRAMAANLVERLGFGSLAASDVLGHVDRSVNRRSYSSYDNLPARADALDAVAAEIERIAGLAPEDEPTPSANVVSLRQRA
jgi:integrase